MATKDEKWVQYAVCLKAHIAEIFEDETSNHIDFSELSDNDNAKAFFHALATAVPASLYNNMTSDNKNHLEFNHLANQLCFEYSKVDE